MRPKAILFDLDGTLLPMDINLFVKDYFNSLATYMAGRGYPPDKFIAAIIEATRAMIANDGSMTCEDRFFEVFCRHFGEGAREDVELLNAFYDTEFDKVGAALERIPEAPEVISELSRRGYRLILATNPLFPRIATLHRVSWCGIDPSQFELITTYENSHYCKPNLDYYREILDKIGLGAEDCLMVGNDALEDMVAGELGMSLYLLPKCLLNGTGRDISAIPQGELRDLLSFVD